MNDDQIRHMAERFLRWKLPENFAPDAGISFKAEFNEGTDHPMRHEPTGTNLLTYGQALEMVRYMVEGASVAVTKSIFVVTAPSGFWEATHISREGAEEYMDRHFPSVRSLGYKIVEWEANSKDVNS